MKLKGSIYVNKTEEEVWQFFNNIDNLAKWDHSVEKVVITSPDKTSPGIGSTFDTFGPSSHDKEGLRTSYQVIDIKPNKSNDLLVTHSNFFKHAVWRNKTEQKDNGTIITISVEFVLRRRYTVLYPIIFLRKGAIIRDMGFLKNEIEK